MQNEGLMVIDNNGLTVWSYVWKLDRILLWIVAGRYRILTLWMYSNGAAVIINNGMTVRKYVCINMYNG